eukprot:bmy_05233T0
MGNHLWMKTNLRLQSCRTRLLPAHSFTELSSPCSGQQDGSTQVWLDYTEIPECDLQCLEFLLPVEEQRHSPAGNIVEGTEQCGLCVRVELTFPHLDCTSDDHKERGLHQIPQAPGFLNLEQQAFSELLYQHFPDESLGTLLGHVPHLGNQRTKLPDVPQALRGGGDDDHILEASLALSRGPEHGDSLQQSGLPFARFPFDDAGALKSVQQATQADSSSEKMGYGISPLNPEPNHLSLLLTSDEKDLLEKRKLKRIQFCVSPEPRVQEEEEE